VQNYLWFNKEHTFSLYRFELQFRSPKEQRVIQTRWLQHSLSIRFESSWRL